MPVKRMKDGKQIWRGRIALPNGKRMEKTCPTKKAALEWEIKTKEKMSSILNHGMACGEWLDRRFENCLSRNLGSAGEKKRTFQRFLQDIDPLKPCAQLTQADVIKHLDRIASDISGDRANRTRKHLAEAWRWGAQFLGLSGRNPFLDIEEYHKGYSKPLLVPNLNDFWLLVQSCEFPDQILLRTYFYTAARADELVRFTWDDTRLDENLVRLSSRKGRSGQWRHHWLRIPKDLSSDLTRLRLQSLFCHAEDRVFCDPADGGPIKDYDHWMKRRCSAADIPYFGFKGIRHLVAVELYRAGHPVAEIQRRLRHESPMTTERYLRSLGLEIGASEVIETLGNLEKKVI